MEFITASRQVDPPASIPSQRSHGPFPYLGLVFLQAADVFLGRRQPIECRHVPFALCLEYVQDFLLGSAAPWGEAHEMLKRDPTAHSRGGTGPSPSSPRATPSGSSEPGDAPH